MRPRVVVVGGGAIGCGCALALIDRGAHVIVLERGGDRFEEPGATGVASWAAAGMIAAQVERLPDGPLSRLCIASRAIYADWARDLVERSGVSVGLATMGVIHAAFANEELDRHAGEVAWHKAAGLRVERVGPREALAIEPALSEHIAGALYMPDEIRVDPPSVVRALRAAIERAGASIRLGAKVTGVRGRSVTLEGGEVIEADAVVLAAGSWSSRLEGGPLAEGSIEPARGQIVELSFDAPPLRTMLHATGCYLSPRDDGRVLVGSTVERVGFTLGTTAEAVSKLLSEAMRLCPSFARASVRRAWSGLRPKPKGELPYIGSTDEKGLFVATGHHRNGMLLAPITGAAIAAMVMGEAPSIDVTPFDPRRAARR